jgi:hypothetical protein
MEAQGERRYSSYSFSTSALDGGEWSVSRPGRALPPGNDAQYPLYRRLGEPQRRCGHRLEEKSSLPPPGIEPRSPGRPFRSQTLYGLSYPAPTQCNPTIFRLTTTLRLCGTIRSFVNCPKLEAMHYICSYLMTLKRLQERTSK